MKRARPKYQSPTTAMSHQKEALRRRTLRPPGYDDAFADLMEMGGGKSKVILDEWQQMISDGCLCDLLVVAPAGSIKNWHQDKSDEQPSELRRHLDPRLLERLRFAGWGRGAAARESVRKLLEVSDRPRALFVNVEAISTSDEVVALCSEFLRPGRAMFVVDEATVIRGAPRIRGKGSYRTKHIVLDLAPLAKARRILTGLVTPKSPLDLFWQFYFLDKRILGYDSYVVFRSRYARVRRTCFEPNDVIRAQLRKAMGLKIVGAADGLLRNKLRTCYEVLAENRERESGCRAVPRKVSREMPRREVLVELNVIAEGCSRDVAVELILRLKSWIKNTIQVQKDKTGAPMFENLDELQAKIAPFSYRVLKEDCMELPPKIYATRDVELTPEQRRMYDEVRRHAVTELEGQHVVAKTVIAQMLRLHQIVLGHCRDNDTKEIFDVPSRRLDVLVDVLGDHAGKVIIWSSYRREIDKIVVRLEKEFGEGCTAQFHGGNEGKRREDDERRFLGDDECRFMVSTQAAGGRGNTWTVADLTVYCSNTHDLEHRLQSEDRNHRRGQTRSVTYVDLVSRDTVEEPIIRALRRKLDLSSVITGDNYREWLI